MQARLSVSEATALVKGCIEESLAPLWVEGEISNFTAHGSGHFYFSIKDAGAQMRCVMFSSANRRLRFQPEAGMSCALFGRLTVYERSGQYQLIAERMLPAGEGELQLALEALKARLAAEGLFDQSRKRELPSFPGTIGVVTSRTGAAIRDIVQVLKRRWPSVQIVLRPTLVQGPGAAEDIAAGIAQLAALSNIDIIIAGRGGGSLEDLWAFNEEVVVRAVADCCVPLISAVGHEIDHTLADLAADLRAPTPSAAAEIAVPDIAELIGLLRRQDEICRTLLKGKLRELSRRLAAAAASRALISPLDRLRQESQRTDDLLARCDRALTVKLERVSQRLRTAGRQLEALSPVAVLHRGYALALSKNGELIRTSETVAVSDEIRIQLGSGVLHCNVLESIPKPPANGSNWLETIE